ncbi:MARVEL domain-containing protein [Aphelenchoides besseyi]|nr:MARVEL domain-containing protein [Aphelenchoides besseyi]KAI6207962.1 MARVEL domain-containing protein [Aphelenchoides besseyi]
MQHEPRQTYSIQQRDGNIVTTTTQSKYEEDIEYSCGLGAPVDNRYCVRPAGILRIIEIIVGFIIVCLIASVWGPGPFKGLLFGQTFILLFTGVCLCVSFIFLLLYFFRIYATHLHFWPWHMTDFIFSTLSAILFVIFGFLEAYYATGAWANNCNSIGGDGFIHNRCRTIIEWAFAAFFCFVNAILYGISAFLASKERRYE